MLTRPPGFHKVIQMVIIPFLFALFLCLVNSGIRFLLGKLRNSFPDNLIGNILLLFLWLCHSTLSVFVALYIVLPQYLSWTLNHLHVCCIVQSSQSSPVQWWQFFFQLRVDLINHLSKPFSINEYVCNIFPLEPLQIMLYYTILY